MKLIVMPIINVQRSVPVPTVPSRRRMFFQPLRLTTINAEIADVVYMSVRFFMKRKKN
jgi:hypothetical protein